MNKKRRITAGAFAGDDGDDDGDGSGLGGLAGDAPWCRGAALPWPPWAGAAPLPLQAAAREAGLLSAATFARRTPRRLLRRATLRAVYDPQRRGAAGGGGSNSSGAGARGGAVGALAAAAVRRARVVELIAAGRALLVLLQSGLCSAFDTETGRWLGDVNAGAGDVVRSMFLNRRRGELLVVASHAADRFRTLRCRAVALPAYGGGGGGDNGDSAGGYDGAAGLDGLGGFGFGGGGGASEPSAPFAPDERVSYPGFFEFDDANGKALVFNAHAGCVGALDAADAATVGMC